MEELRQTISYQLYEQSNENKLVKLLDKRVEKAQDFYNGNQFGVADKNIVRVTMNICNFMVSIKASKLCGTPIYLVFTADNPNTDCVALRQFDEYNTHKLALDGENYQAAINGMTNGTEITFYRWDDDDTTYKGIYKGGLKLEHIDPRNFRVANPYINDVQNQEWVMFWNEVSLGELKKIMEFRKGENKEDKIARLEKEARKQYSDDFIDKDSINSALVRVFTRYFRIDGEVYYTLETETVELFAYPHPLSRKNTKTKVKKLVEDYIKESKNEDPNNNENNDLIRDFDIDYEDMLLNSTNKELFDDEEYKEVKEKFSLYPFAIFEPIKENRSFYGRSDVVTLIPIQRGLNFLLSMNLKCAENNAYNKIFAKPDALQGQEITNEPSQILVDYSQFTNGWGIKMAESQPMPNGLLDFAQGLLGMTRVVYGFNDVMDGSITNQDMSGYMLNQMIKQSNQAIEQQQKLFWEYNVKMAEIRLMFYKHYVDKARYTFEYSDSELEDEEEARKAMYAKLAAGGKLETMPNATLDDFAQETSKVQLREIRNEDLYGVNFDIAIDAMQGLSDSKLIEQQQLDNMMVNGTFQNMTPDQIEFYLIMSPTVTPRQRAEYRKYIERQKFSTIQQQQQVIEQLTAKLQESAELLKQIDGKNKYQEQFLKNLQSEFANKINSQNKIIDSLMSDLSKQKSEGEVKSDNARGVEGGLITQAEQA